MLTQKTINEICFLNEGKVYNFFIPSYQRGYRWTDETTKLLDDLFEFSRSIESKEAKYCLQPIIVRHKSDGDTDNFVCYEVIDGQQRLTTIHLIVDVLLRGEDARFSITYERGDENIVDAYYKNNARSAINNWIDSIQNSNPKIRVKSEIEMVLLSQTSVIWYELKPETTAAECRKIFRNINAGKIALTVSELTKAVLLNSKLYANAKSEQLYKASVWDEMARVLENNLFWGFITNNAYGKGLQTHTDYLLMLLWYKENNNNKEPERDNEVFNYFESVLIGKNAEVTNRAESVFANLRQYFRTFQDWYANSQWCNYIGYLVRYNDGGIKKLVDIIEKYESLSHAKFTDYLESEIKLKIGNIDIKNLTYGQTKENEMMQNILLVFAIQISNSLEQRFDFEPSDGWSLEHVFAQNSQIVGGNDSEGMKVRIRWLQEYLDSAVIDIESRGAEGEKRRIELLGLRKDIQNAISKKEIDRELFTSLFNTIGTLVEHYKIDIHNISNITLLGKGDNSRLQNKPFYEKRALVLREIRSNNHHIPQSTINVFQKNYSIPINSDGAHTGYRGNLDIWSVEDAASYLEHIEYHLRPFIKVGDVNDN